MSTMIVSEDLVDRLRKFQDLQSIRDRTDPVPEYSQSDNIKHEDDHEVKLNLQEGFPFYLRLMIKWTLFT
jgi:hypothetical protein